MSRFAPFKLWPMASLWQGFLVWQAFRRDDDLDEVVREALEDWLRGLTVSYTA